MSRVDDSVTEVNERLNLFGPMLNGLKAFVKLPLKPQTLEELQQEIVRFERRIDLLVKHRLASEALLADGHPELPTEEINPLALTDLNAMESDMVAALSHFASNAAASVKMTAGDPEKK